MNWSGYFLQFNVYYVAPKFLPTIDFTGVLDGKKNVHTIESSFGFEELARCGESMRLLTSDFFENILTVNILMKKKF